MPFSPNGIFGNTFVSATGERLWRLVQWKNCAMFRGGIAMPSPFPGMDPYLEQPAIWSDLHLTLIVAMRADVNLLLPKGYLAAADRHVWIEDTDEGSWHVVGPDIHVSETGVAAAEMQSKADALAVVPRTVN